MKKRFCVLALLVSVCLVNHDAFAGAQQEEILSKSVKALMQNLSAIAIAIALRLSYFSQVKLKPKNGWTLCPSAFKSEYQTKRCVRIFYVQCTMKPREQA